MKEQNHHSPLMVIQYSDQLMLTIYKSFITADVWLVTDTLMDCPLLLKLSVIHTLMILYGFQNHLLSFTITSITIHTHIYWSLWWMWTYRIKCFYHLDYISMSSLVSQACKMMRNNAISSLNLQHHMSLLIMNS